MGKWTWERISGHVNVGTSPLIRNSSNQATIRQDDHPEALGDQQQLGIRPITDVFGQPVAPHDGPAIAKRLDKSAMWGAEPEIWNIGKKE